MESNIECFWSNLKSHPQCPHGIYDNQHIYKYLFKLSKLYNLNQQ